MLSQTVPDTKQLARDKIATDTKTFLKAGGKIVPIPAGMTGDEYRPIRNRKQKQHDNDTKE